jgi:aminoglycoside phosphotransferase (APT) family kinase protein
MAGPMHDDEVSASIELVGQLLADQFPQWADLPIAPVRSAGTDHAIYRLGEGMSVRLPLRPSAAGQVDKEQLWLPRLAPHLPCPVSRPLGLGAPGHGYPWKWSVCAWLLGDNPTAGDDATGWVADLARFVDALHAIDLTGGPPPGRHNFGRGVPLALRDAMTRQAIAESKDLIDTEAATAAWEADLAAPAWSAAPVWIHGDLCPGNLLVAEGRLAAVIDFGGLAVGDPACDLIVAWNLLTGPSRETYRAALGVDEASWARGRGWALSVALLQLPYYVHSNPVLAANSRLTIAAVLADHGLG